MFTFLSGFRMKDRDNKVGSSKDSETSSSKEMVCKTPKCRTYNTKYLPLMEETGHSVYYV
jgi:hypothetical protein